MSRVESVRNEFQSGMKPTHKQCLSTSKSDRIPGKIVLHIRHSNGSHNIVFMAEIRH